MLQKQNTQTVEQQYMLPVNHTKVMERVIDVYLWIGEDLNTAEAIMVGHHIVNLAKRRATDVELYYRENYIYPVTENDIQDSDLLF